MKKNYNVNADAKNMEEAFRHSPADSKTMLESVYMMYQVMMTDEQLKSEKKKVMNRRKGFALGCTAILALVADDDKKNMPASPAAFTKLTMELVSDEGRLKQVVEGTIAVIDGSFPFESSDFAKYNTSNEQARKTSKEETSIMVYDQKTKNLKKMDMNNIPDELADVLRRIKSGEIKPKGM